MLILMFVPMPCRTQDNAGAWQPESVYLQTDRNIYSAGEYLFYSLFLQGTPGQLSRFAYLAIRDQQGRSFVNIRLEMDHRISFGSIYLSDTLNTGIYQIVCYTNCMRNDSEASYFKKEILIGNQFEKDPKLDFESRTAVAFKNTDVPYPDTDHPKENLEIHLDQQLFKPNEKITFTVNTTNLPANSSTRLSVSVSEIFPGIPVEPSIAYCFNASNKKIFRTESGTTSCTFHAETNGAVLQGQVFPPRPCEILLSSADSLPNLQYTTADSLGAFSMLLNRCYDGKELIVKTKENVNVTIHMDSRFNLDIPFTSSGIFNVPGIIDYLKRNGDIIRVSKAYGNQPIMDTIQEFLPAKTTPRVYYSPTYVIYPSEYLELNDFIEISRELIPAFKIRKSNDRFISGYINIQDQSRMDPEPQIFLDGVPVDDVNQIISLGTRQIKRIETLPVWRYYGNHTFKGILSVFTENTEINRVQFRTPAIRYRALSSQPHTKPGAFNAGSRARRIPDVRQLLLWEPDIPITGNGKCLLECYASDLHGIYRINIQGITAEGIPVSASRLFTVQSGTK